MTLAEAVRELRHAVGETQEVFAKRLRRSVRHITRWEYGRQAPHGFDLAKLIFLAKQWRRPELVEPFLEQIRKEYQGDVQLVGGQLRFGEHPWERRVPTRREVEIFGHPKDTWD